MRTRSENATSLDVQRLEALFGRLLRKPHHRVEMPGAQHGLGRFQIGLGLTPPGLGFLSHAPSSLDGDPSDLHYHMSPNARIPERLDRVVRSPFPTIPKHLRSRPKGAGQCRKSSHPSTTTSAHFPRTFRRSFR